jgi:hypothetical protein
MLTVMTIKTVTGAIVDVDAAEIVRVADAVFAARRKTHGGPPRKPRTCRWCGEQFLGKLALHEHERDYCSQRPSSEVTAHDLVAWVWPPDAA